MDLAGRHFLEKAGAPKSPGLQQELQELWSGLAKEAHKPAKKYSRRQSVPIA